MGQDFFGLPRVDDPEFLKQMSNRKLNLLRELRYVSNEIGYHEANRLPVEIRRWWIDEMRREAEQKSAEFENMRSGRKTVDAR